MLVDFFFQDIAAIGSFENKPPSVQGKSKLIKAAHVHVCVCVHARGCGCVVTVAERPFPNLFQSYFFIVILRTLHQLLGH